MQLRKQDHNLVAKHRRRSPVFWLKRFAQAGLFGAALLGTTPIWAADTVCLATTFPDGLQVHSPSGSIHLGYNAQLLDNPDNILATPALTQNGGSNLFSCGDQDCAGSINADAQTLPGFSTTNSTTNLTVGWNAQAVFGQDGVREYKNITLNSQAVLSADAVTHSPDDEYLIDQLKLGYKATLNLLPGSYWVRKLTINSEVSINVIGTGTVRLFVHDNLNIGYKAQLNPAAVGAPIDASQLLLVTYGNLQTNSEALVNAIIYGQGSVTLGYKSQITGVVSAASISTNSQVVVHYQAPKASAEFDPLCPGAPVDPPVLSISAPVADSFTNDDRQTIQLDYSSDGEIDTESIELTLNASALANTCTADQTIAQCIPDDALPEGEVTIGATIADTTGQVSNSAQVGFTVDTIPPVVVIDTPVDNLQTNTTQQTVAGNISEPVQSLLLNINSDINSITADTDNNFSEPATLVEGVNLISITASDFASNQGNVTHQVTLDTVLPPIVIEGQIDVGTYVNGQTTITGTDGSVEANATVIITNLRTGEVIIVIADANGAFLATVNGMVGDVYSIVVQDSAGNQSAAVQITNAVILLPPEITSTPTIGATIDVPYSYQIAANDPNGDPLSYGFTEKPLGMNVNTDGLVTWNPINDGSYPVTIVVSDGTGMEDTQSFTVTVTGEAAQTPVLDALGDQIALLGQTLTLQLSASDPDSDVIEFFVAPLPLPANMLLDSSSGVFTFTPAANQVGDFVLKFMATDGRFYAEQTITITVPAPAGVTQLRGQVLTSGDAPLPGVRLEMGGVETLTDANGDFFLDNIPVSGNVRLLVDGNVVDPALGAFATVPEMIPIIAGTENLLEPAIFLLPLDVASADPVDPATTSIITSSRFIEGLNITEPVTLTIPPGRAMDDSTGLPFVGDIHISRVTDPTKGPRPLPEEFDLSVYIAIQPFGVTYPDPVPISFPNVEDFPPDTRLDFFALNHETGVMEKIGEGLVSADGKTVDSIGGVVKSNSWHGIVPQGPVNDPSGPPGVSEPPSVTPPPSPPSAPPDAPSECKNCPCDGCVIDKATGNLKEWHVLPKYTSLEKPRLLQLQYNSNLANPKPILPINSGFGNRAAPPDLMSMRINVDGIDMGRDIFSLVRIEPSSVRGQFKLTRPAIQINAAMFESGIYNYDLSTNCYFPISRRQENVLGQIIVQNESNSPFGAGWTIAGLQRIYAHSSGRVLLTEGTASSLMFEPLDPLVDPNGFESPLGDFSVLTRLGDGTLERRMKDGTRYRFDLDGLMVQAIDRNGNTTDYQYDTAQRLEAIIDPVGQSYSLQYSAGRLSSISDPLNRVTRFEHDSEGNLIGIIEPNGDRRGFEYLPGKNLMTAQIDQRDNRTEYFYNHADRISETLLPDGSQPQFDIAQIKGLADPQSMGDPGDGTRERPTSAPLLLEEVDQRYVDNNGNPLVSELDVRNQPVKITDAVGRVYNYERDDDSNPTKTTRPNDSVVDRVFDDRGNSISRKETFNDAEYQYSYDAFSLVTSYTNPNNHTTTYIRDLVTGNLSSAINHLGHTTTYEYESRGLVERIVTSNLLEVVFTYNLQGLVETITETPPVGSPGNVRLTQYSYDNAGQLTQSISPDGITLDIEYDDKGRRTRVTDNLNQVVEYTYDAHDNLVQTDTRNSDSGLALTVERIFDARNRLFESTKPHLGGEDSITTRTLDNNSNIIGLKDPNDNSTSNEFDDEDRLIKNTHRLDGVTRYEYDTNDRIIKVTAPNDVVTSYTYDLIGRRLTETSSDRGTLRYTYDENNNVTSITDGRGITATMTYDELERLSTKTYPNSIVGKIEDVTYTYDNCPFGLGRICQRTDESGTWNFEYDAFGNITKETKIELGVAYVTEYQYDERDRILQMKYPTGRVVNFDRDGIRRIEAISTDINSINTDIVSGIKYRADNKMTQCTFGNGLVDNRSYDLQGRLLSQNLGTIDSRTYTYDNNSNVLSRNTTPQTSVYSYDKLDRLTSDQIDANSAFIYQYDLNHNRQSKTQISTLGESYEYKTNTNRLARHDQFTMDSFSPTVTDRQFIYSDTNRIFQVIDDGLLAAEYIYNHDGQRTRKVVYDNSVNPATSETTLYHYDLMGYLIAESSSAGTSKRDYIWAEGMKSVAQINIDSGVDTINYLHVDHLKTPRFATNSGQQISWRWEGEAFGETAGQNIPAEINLRFPGQYFDRETGDHYNWKRYYRPGNGRYTTNDPIGLVGGTNTYAYAGNNSIRYFDPRGLLIALPPEFWDGLSGGSGGGLECGVGDVPIGPWPGSGIGDGTDNGNGNGNDNDDDGDDGCDQLLDDMVTLFVYVLSQIEQGVEATFLIREYEKRAGEACIACPRICQDIPRFR